MLGAVGAAVPLWDKLTDSARRSKASAKDAGKDLATVADQLAVAVAAQWKAEARCAA